VGSKLLREIADTQRVLAEAPTRVIAPGLACPITSSGDGGSGNAGNWALGPLLGDVS